MAPDGAHHSVREVRVSSGPEQPNFSCDSSDRGDGGEAPVALRAPLSPEWGSLATAFIPPSRPAASQAGATAPEASAFCSVQINPIWLRDPRRLEASDADGLAVSSRR